MLHVAGLSREPSCSASICSTARHAAPYLRTQPCSDCRHRGLIVERKRCSKFSRNPSRAKRQFITSAHASLQSTVQPLISRDLIATVLAALGAYVWVRAFDWMATHGVLEQVEASARTCIPYDTLNSRV